MRILLVSPDRALAAGLESALKPFADHVRVAAMVPGYPSAPELARILRAHLPDAVFLSFERPDLALAVMRSLEAEADSLPVVGFDGVANAQIIRESMRAGARDFLASPFAGDAVAHTLANLAEVLAKAPPTFGTTDRIFSFLPSKPGVGATTLAVNTAGSLARRMKSGVLLADLDMACGMIRFLLKLFAEYSITDAVSHADHLDENLWPQLVALRDNVSLLGSGSLNPNAFLDPADLQALINFARHRYGAICLDHSGNFERHSIAALEESKQIFLVSTPEISSLQLARERLDVIRSKGLAARTSVLLNRVHDPATDPKHTEDALGLPVTAIFPNDYAAVARSVEAADWVSPQTRLGHTFTSFAAKISGQQEVASAPRRLLGLFARPKAVVAATATFPGPSAG